LDTSTKHAHADSPFVHCKTILLASVVSPGCSFCHVIQDRELLRISREGSLLCLSCLSPLFFPSSSLFRDEREATREACLRITQRISDTFLKCKTFRLRVRRDQPRLSVMLRILIAQTSSGFTGTKASDRSRWMSYVRFFFSNCLLRAMSNSIGGSGVLST